jgi:UDP-N-acetylmuramoyl-tripeptide--D-alanyl-D-alanine ligase
MGPVRSVVLTAETVVRVTGGRLVAGAADRVLERVSIDSRTLRRGSLFVALRGDRFDGHDFTAAALARGAAGLLVQAAPADPGTTAVIVVPDTLQALQALAGHVRRASDAIVVAITGSAGKTTTKEIAADLLALRYRVFRSRGNFNNHIGLPLSLLELLAGPEIAVVELGMNHAGEIRTLIGLAAPQIRVWTNVGDAHLGQFGTVEAIARAKAEVLEAAEASTLIVANADDPLVMAHVKTFSGRRLTYGESRGADVRAEAVIDRGFDGTVAEVATPAGRLELSVPLPGRAHLSNTLAAVAVAVELGVPIPGIEATVAALLPVTRRGASMRLASGTRVVDDSYNASPMAVAAALAALGATPTGGHRLAVLGEMLELGDASRALHERCGAAAVAAGVNTLVVIGGPDADGLAEGALAAGMPAVQIHRFGDSRAAAPFVLELVEPGDLVLVKGSRGTRTDIVADALMEVA